MEGLSKKEIKIVSYLELKDKRFFTREDIKKFFKDYNEMTVYLHRLKNKKRIISIRRGKYYLVPIEAYQNKWSEHPYIIIDEIFDNRGYYIGGKSAANYWHLIDQVPTIIDVYNTTRQGTKSIFNAKLRLIRTTKKNMKSYVLRKINNHPFIIASKEKSRKWI